MEPRASTGTSTRRTCVGLAFLLQACGYTPGPSYSKLCPASEVALCDVRERTCQEQVARYIACLAERDFTEIPVVLSSTSTRDRDRYGSRLRPVQPALIALGLSSTVSLGRPVQPWEWVAPVIERRDLPTYDDRVAVVGLGAAMAMALFDQTEGWGAELDRRSGFDDTLALRALWVGVAQLWAHHLDAALLQQAYDERAWPQPLALEFAELASFARDYELQGGPLLVDQVWRLQRGDVQALLRDPPRTVLALVEPDRVEPQPIADNLPLARSTLVVRASAPLGCVGLYAWNLRSLPGSSFPYLAGDRLFAVEDTQAGTHGGLWVLARSALGPPPSIEVELQAIGSATAIAAHPDPMVRRELLEAARALLLR